MVDSISLSISLTAVGITALIWLESRKQSRLLQTVVKSLPYARSPRRKNNSSRKKVSKNVTQSSSIAQAEERRRLKLELEKEKHQWQKNKDIAKGIAWLIDHIDESDDDCEN